MRGGRRPGAGRKPGKQDKFDIIKAAEIITDARAAGLRLPHELLNEWANTGQMYCSAGPTILTPQQMIACAVAAGPYYAPRLISHEVSGKGGGAIAMSMTAQVAYYVPENNRRVAPPAPANDAAAAVPMRGNGSGQKAA